MALVFIFESTTLNSLLVTIIHFKGGEVVVGGCVVGGRVVVVGGCVVGGGIVVVGIGAV